MKAAGKAYRSGGGGYVHCHCYGSPRRVKTNLLHGVEYGFSTVVVSVDEDIRSKLFYHSCNACSQR